MIEEHLKNRVEQYSHSRLFSINTGAMAAFCMSPNLMTAAMAMPVDRKSTSSSVHENHAQSGMHIKENHIEIGEKIEIKPELENHEHSNVFDTAPINSIGSIMSGVQEIKENWAATREANTVKKIHDKINEIEASVNSEIENDGRVVHDAKPDDSKAGTPEKQAVKEPGYTIHEADLSELLDEIYDTDIALYQEFDRVGSPDRVETELTKAVGKVQDVASSLVNASDFSNMHDHIIGADSDPQSMVALGKGVMKVAEFAGEIFGTVIEPAANAIGSKVRRTLRDDLSVSQAKAQDIGDITHVVAGILIPGGAAKAWKMARSTKAGKVVKACARPSWRQSEVDELARYAGRNVETQVSFLNGERCRYGFKGSIRVDTLIDNIVAIEMKNYNLVTNVDGLVNDIVKQALKHQPHLPQGVTQVFKIDARGQVCTPVLEDSVRARIISKTGGILNKKNIQFIYED